MPYVEKEWKVRVLRILRFLMLAVSVLLIVLISLNVFTPHFNHLAPEAYRRVQLPVCVVYLMEYFFALYCSPSRSRFFRHNLLTLLICIPYMTILDAVGVAPSGLWGYIIHYMPTLRAVLALAIVARFVSTDKLIGLFASYVIILLLAIYFSSLIFYLVERDINPHVTNYGSALWWCVLQATTLGASFYAMTTAGKAVAMIVSCMGVMMFPLFTVFLTRTMQRLAGAKARQSAKNS